MFKPKVSIILPNYNSHQYVSDTLNSIINQSYKNWELILVDDNSDKNTREILNNYIKEKNIKIIFLKKNMGTAFCRNYALRLSSSEYVAFIDSDDAWQINKLEEQVNFMIQNNYLFSYTNYSTFRSNDLNKLLKVIYPPIKLSFNDFIKNTSIATSTMMIKSDYAKKYKFTRTKICEDYFYKCRILKDVGYAYCLEKDLTKYRITKNSLQSKKFRNIYWVWKINKYYNKLGLLKNLISIIFISYNSLKKYGFK